GDEPIAPTTAMPAATIKNEPRKTRSRDEVDTQFEFMAWGCLVHESPDTLSTVLPTRALACQYELLHGEKMFAPVAKLWGACASRVLASSPSRAPLFGLQTQSRTVRKFVSARRRKQVAAATATQSIAY